jgi:phenylalanyl-tRNA synthetase beta chain
MSVSLRWIREFVDLPTDDPAEIAEALVGLGVEVESVEHVGAEFSGVIVAKVIEVMPHPDADTLRVVRLETGAAEHTVVCGAWNFDAGAVVPLATVGAVLAGGLEVGEREIRGVASPGMICSEAELGLGEDASGILVLGDDYAPLGSDFAATLPYPDVQFHLEITPNRPDAMSVYGIARDLAAHYNVPLRTPEHGIVESGEPTTGRVVVEDPEGCPRFTAREIRGVTIGPSPLWMRLRLRDAGERAISNVVDVTNYVMLEYGQPIHAFDLDRIPEETLVIRRARRDERLMTLDSMERTLHPDDIVVSGVDQALALAGIMGGEESEVSDETSRIFLEVAHFDAPRTLLSGKRHNLRTEAVARFERGVDPALPPRVSARAAALIAELSGGEVAPGFIDVYPNPIEPWTVELPAGEAKRLLGIDLAPDEAAVLLGRLGFQVAGSDPMLVTVPTFRPDVTRPADLVEEIARLYGYDRIPERLPMGAGGGVPVWEKRRRLVRQVMVGAGYHEIMSYSFLGTAHMEALGLPEDDPRYNTIAVRNPLNDEEGLMRTTLLPAVLNAVRVNQTRHNEDVAVFEIGHVYLPSTDVLPDERRAMAFATAGRLPGPGWPGERPRRDVWDATGIWETLAATLGVGFRLEQAVVPAFHPGRCARVVVDGTAVGTVGEVHPEVARRHGISGRVAAGEVDLEPLLVAPPPFEFRVPSLLPPVVFDLAFDLDDDASAADLVAAVRAGGGPHLERLVIFDVFQGAPLEPGRKSIAVRLTFRHPERTLTDDELAPVRESIAASVADGLGGRLRSA